MYYIGSNHQPPLHPMMTKGARDTDTSRAQVCFFFFFFFTYSINDFILIGYISMKITKTDTTMDGRRRHVMANDPT